MQLNCQTQNLKSNEYCNLFCFVLFIDGNVSKVSLQGKNGKCTVF